MVYLVMSLPTTDGTIDNIYQKLHSIRKKEKRLNKAKKDIIDPLNLEICQNLHEISKELKREFKFDEQFVTISNAIVFIGDWDCDKSGFVKLEFQELELEFEVAGNNYWVVYNLNRDVVDCPERVYFYTNKRKFGPNRRGREPEFSRGGNHYPRTFLEQRAKMIFDEDYTCFRSHPENDNETIYDLMIMLESERFFWMSASLQEDLDVIYQVLALRLDMILMSIQRKICEYLLYPIRLTKQNVRLILNAQKKKDGVLGGFPHEIVRKICEYVLKDLSELRTNIVE